MNLDIVTILVALSLIALVNAFTITAAWHGAKSMRSIIGYWSLSQILLFVGVILVGFRNILPDFISIIIANSCIVGSQVAIQEGIARYMGQTGYLRKASLAIFSVQVVLFLVFTYVLPDVSFRIIVYGLATVLLCLISILTLQNRGNTTAVPIRFFSALLLFQIVVVSFRTASAFNQGYYADFLRSGFMQALGLLGTTVFYSGLSIGFFWLIAYRLRLERQRAEDKLQRSEQRLRKDFQLGEMIQRVSLTPDCGNEQFEVRGVYQPQHFVSGDIYGYYHDASKNILFGFVIDLMGHGLPTALQTFSVRALFQDCCSTTDSLTELLARINRKIASFVTDEIFVAAICFEFNFSTLELRYSAAGINCVFMVKDGISLLDKIPGMFLGVSDEPEFEERKISFAAGDSFYFMTDGLYEPLVEIGFTGEADFAQTVKRLKEHAASGLTDDAAALCIWVK